MREIIGRYKFSPAQLRLMTKSDVTPVDTPVDTIEKAHPREYRFTVDEFVRMAEIGILDSDDRVELVDGVIVEMAPIGRPHGNRVSDVARAFWEHVPKSVRVYIGSTIRLDDRTGPQPDIVLLNPQASADEETVPRPEDILLIVEVSASTLRTDRGAKARRYAQSGIPELWIFVLATEQIEVCRQPTPEGYAEVRRFSRGDTLAIQALPGIQISMDELLA